MQLTDVESSELQYCTVNVRKQGASKVIENLI